MQLNKGTSQERMEFYKGIKDNPLASASASFVSSILLIIILFITAIQPTVRIITDLRDQIDKFEAVNNKLEKKLVSLNQVVPEYRKLGSVKELISIALPNNHEFTTLERQIRYLVTKNDLSLNSLSISGFPVVGNASQILQNKNTALQINTTLGDQSQIMFISVKLNTTGEYTVIKSFVNDFQKILRVTTIDQLSLTGDNRSSGIEVELSLRGNVYYLAENTEE